MKEIAITEFKARCSRLLAQVQRTGEPIRIVGRGKAVAEIFPVVRKGRPRRWLGSMKATAQTWGDIVGPTGSFEDWEAGR